MTGGFPVLLGRHHGMDQFSLSDGFFRVPLAAGTAEFYFYENEHLAVVRNQVDLAEARPEVGRGDYVAAPFKVPSGLDFATSS